MLKLLRLDWKRLDLQNSLEFGQVQLHVDPQYEANKSTIRDLRNQLHTFMIEKKMGEGFGLAPIGWSPEIG